MINQETKSCVKCFKILPINQFYKGAHTKDHLSRQCRLCREEQIRLFRQSKYGDNKQKECKKCKKKVLFSEFTKNLCLSDGLLATCKKCVNSSRLKRKNNQDKYLIRQTQTGTKKCKDCLEDLPYRNFGLSLKYKDGVCSQCKECYAKKRKSRTKEVSGKTCSKCQIYKTSVHFSRRTDSSDGLKASCKMCDKSLLKARAIRFAVKSAEEKTNEKKVHYPNGKFCTKCVQTKNIGEFNELKSSTGGLSSLCKKCASEATKKSSRKWNEKKRKMMENESCKNCGITDIRTFDFAHWDRSKKLRYPCGKGINPSALRESKFNKSRGDFRILCASCHRVETAIENSEQKDLLVAAPKAVLVAREKIRRGKCQDCSLPVKGHYLSEFEFDHPENTVKVASVCDMVNGTYKQKELIDEMAKCDLLCVNCHRIRTWDRRQIKKLLSEICNKVECRHSCQTTQTEHQYSDQGQDTALPKRSNSAVEVDLEVCFWAKNRQSNGVTRT